MRQIRAACRRGDDCQCGRYRAGAGNVDRAACAKAEGRRVDGPGGADDNRGGERYVP